MRLIDADMLKVKQQEDADLFIGDDTLSGKSRRDEALNAVANIVNAPTVDIDAITESHERIGYDRGFRDGYAQATSDVMRHGHWERYLNVGLKWCCSECASRFTIPFSYCPNCGAKNEVEEDED